MLKGAKRLSPDTASSHSPPPCPFWRCSLADGHLRPTSRKHGLFYCLAHRLLRACPQAFSLLRPHRVQVWGWRAAHSSTGRWCLCLSPGPSSTQHRAGQPHPSPQPSCPCVLQCHLCQNMDVLMQILLLIASPNLESNAVGARVGCPLLGSTNTDA